MGSEKSGFFLSKARWNMSRACPYELADRVSRYTGGEPPGEGCRLALLLQLAGFGVGTATLDDQGFEDLVGREQVAGLLVEAVLERSRFPTERLLQPLLQLVETAGEVVHPEGAGEIRVVSRVNNSAICRKSASRLLMG